ncbi:MAG: S8 family serine peptidase, partial [Anaerolineales bacterium]
MKNRIFVKRLILIPIILSMLGSAAFAELNNYQIPVLDDRFKQGELIVGLKLNGLKSATEMGQYSIDFFGDPSLTSAIRKNGVTRITQLFEDVPLDSLSVKHQLPGVFILKAGKNADLYTLKRQLEAHPLVGYVEYNYTVTITAPYTPNDPQLSKQWGLSNNKNRDINAPEAWGIERGKPHVLIAVVDTGVLYTHPDLQGSRMRTDIDKDFFNNDNDAIDDQGHGTHVAGIIAASGNNGLGITGVCMNCSILPIKVLGSDGSGSVDGVANGIIYAAKRGADVINLSLGMSHSCGCSKTLAKALNYAFERGSLIIAAAGNDYVSGLAYPASSSRVMAIGASNKNDKRANFSSYGPGLDILAPGQSILSTYKSNDYKLLDGTSMAAPHAAGVAGLILSKRPNLKNTQV